MLKIKDSTHVFCEHKTFYSDSLTWCEARLEYNKGVFTKLLNTMAVFLSKYLLNRTVLFSLGSPSNGT